MRLFPPELEIGELEGFAPDKDIFGRKVIGEGLTYLLSSLSEPTVIAIDSQWGSGKTVFLKMWAGELRRLGFPVVYFDAFKNDFVDDAFTAIAGEIISLVQERRKAKTPLAKKFIAKATEASKILLRSGVRLGVKAATLSTVDTKDFEAIAAAAADEFSGLADKYVGELLTRQREHKETFEAFRDALSSLPNLVRTDAENEGAAKPLILIIDELDRCRPVFALELLERIKHFFSAPNVHFVLGAHLTQLCNSVVAAYGVGIDARKYLEKFIHLTVNLRDRSNYAHERVISKYITYLGHVLEFDQKDKNPNNDTFGLVRHFAERRELSLRTIERIFGALSTALAFTPANHFRLPPLVSGLAILKVTDPILYFKAGNRTLGFSEACAALELNTSDGEENNSLRFYRKWWQYCTDGTMPAAEAEEMNRSLFNYSFRSRFDLVPYLANEVMDRLEPMRR